MYGINYLDCVHASDVQEQNRQYLIKAGYT